MDERRSLAVIRSTERCWRRVGHRRPGRQDPVLDPHVRPPSEDLVHRPVPAVDRAVVQCELRQGDVAGVPGPDPRCRRRSAAALEVADVLVEQPHSPSPSSSHSRRTTPAGERPAGSAPRSGYRRPVRTTRSWSRGGAACRGRRGNCGRGQQRCGHACAAFQYRPNSCGSTWEVELHGGAGGFEDDGVGAWY